MTHPYRDREDFCFWSRAMSSPAPGQIDPVTRFRTITTGERIATIGSCFAQHLARNIRDQGLDYFVAETAPEGMSPEGARRRNFGVFSARYGNVYTVRQALQLFDRAYGRFQPDQQWWRRENRFVDPFRPQIEPEGFSCPEEVQTSAQEHLGYVRDVFSKCHWLVFTLGLTEGWRSKSDGAIYPLAPGVAGGEWSADRYEFVNFTATEVRDDLEAFINRIHSVNPSVNVLLTVSPVSLAATFEQRHVWVSTTFSKSALRVAADEVERRMRNVIYFPAYEIITSPAAGGRYYSDELRQVTELGVRHVMRMFTRHFIDGDGATSIPSSFVARSAMTDDVVCDEEVIDAALRRSGFKR